MSLLDDKTKKVPLDENAVEQLTTLRYFVENLSKQADLALRGGVYRELTKAEVFKVSFDGWEIGYKLEDHSIFFTRKIFVMCEQNFDEVPEEQSTPVMAAVMEVLLDRGQSTPEIDQIAANVILITQNFMPIFQKELNPRLVSKGRLVH